MREEYPIIVDWIKEGSTVIDLGCGKGELLEMLMEGKAIKELGIDWSRENIRMCKYYQIKANRSRIDRKNLYMTMKDNQYDYSICNVTLQMVEHPEVLLREMFRISKYQIISFPNFAKWNNRLELLFKGRMPKHMLSGYEWYNTRHIHQLSLKDFEEYIKDKARILKRKCLPDLPFKNLTTHTAIYLLEAI